MKIKKLLVPVDYSPASKGSLDYSRLLSKNLGASVMVLNVNTADSKSRDVPEDLAVAAEIASHKENLKNLKKFTQDYPNELKAQKMEPPPLKYKIKSGAVIEEILKTAGEEGIDLIVIGTRAKHNWKDYLLGSVCTGLIHKTTVPVLIIPEGIEHKPIRQIAFATEILLTEETVFKRLHRFAVQMGATIHQIYVQTLPRDFSDEKEEALSTGWLKNYSTDYSKITVVRDQSVSKGIDYFIEKHQMDLLAMYIPKRTLVEKFFHPSQTSRMVYHTKLPLLIFREA